MNTPPTIGLVDDDAGMLKALRRLLLAEGYLVKPFVSAEAFLEALPSLSLDCLILDVSLPGLNGLELQERLHASGIAVPILFLTGRADVPMTVRAIRTGAVNFLTKPVQDSDLFAALQEALEIRRAQVAVSQALSAERARLATLTPRELEVLRHVITGKMNKEIAADLGASEHTIKIHRMRITEKLACPSIAGLVHLASRLGLEPAA